MKKRLALLLVAVLLVSCFAVCASAEEENISIEINGFNSLISGSDAYLYNSVDTWANNNPNWAYSIHLVPVAGADGYYTAVKTVNCTGNDGNSDPAAILAANYFADFDADNGDLIITVHSNGSDDPNAKAWGINAEQIVRLDGVDVDALTVSADAALVYYYGMTAPGEGDSSDEPVDPSDPSDPEALPPLDDGDGVTEPWEKDYTIDEAGDYILATAEGYRFTINYVDGTIAGEDCTLITNSTAYDACNPNWAISVVLAATDVAGEYEVVKVVSCPGSAAAAGIEWAEDTLVLVVHSASSQPGEYANWLSKVAAVALEAGDTIAINEEQTLAVVGNLADLEEPEAPETSDPSEDKTPEAGDMSNTIVFAVLALVAIAGSAVVIKTRK